MELGLRVSERMGGFGISVGLSKGDRKVSAFLWRSWRGRGDGGVGFFVVLFAFGAAFDAGGGEPGVEFGGDAGVEVVHHGVESGDFLGALEEELLDLAGALDALEVVGGLGGVFAVEGGAVGAEVFDEVGGEEFFDEPGAEGGFGAESGGGVFSGIVLKKGEQGVGVGGDLACSGFGGDAVGIAEAGFVERVGAGGAGDVFEIEPKGIEQELEAGGIAQLADFRGVEPGGNGGDAGEALDGCAAGGEIRLVLGAEVDDAVEALVAAKVAIAHGEDFLGVDRKLSDDRGEGKMQCRKMLRIEEKKPMRQVSFPGMAPQDTGH